MRGRLALSLAAILLGPAYARADIFVLANQGEVRGELVNKTEVPRRKYVIQLAGGGELTLDKEQVTEVRRESAAQLEYERRRAAAKDAVADHWALAEYCRQNSMLASRDHHLKRILELEPDHEQARRGLHYTRVDGGWKTQEQIMTQRGYVRYKGDWKLPQEVELEEARRKAELIELEWYGNIKRWRGWLRTDKAEKALEQIRQIEDASAVKAIQGQLEDEKDPKLRKLWLETLGQIDSPAARSVLVDVSLADRDLELRLIAVEQLGKARAKDPGVVKQYVKALKSTENPIINRAAIGLAAMEDPSAIGPLIDALVTNHKKTITQGSQAIRSTFGTGGNAGAGGLSVGSSTKTIQERLSNQDVRDALVKLAGVNFNFEVDRWKAWHAAQRQDAAINVRRD